MMNEVATTKRQLDLPNSGLAVAAVLMMLSPTLAWTQSPASRRAMQQQQQQRAQQQRKIQDTVREVAQNATHLPTDPELLTLHREFLAKAEKLGMDYERKRDYAKAREVYESIVRLVPKYAAAEVRLSQVLKAQASSDTRTATVSANKGWQDSGVNLESGMPVHTEVSGTWKVVYETDAKGIEIPEKSRSRVNGVRLGTLLGVIASSQSELEKAKPFVVKQGGDFMAPKTGRLFFRMYDVDPTDNQGQLRVTIQSSFAR